MSNLDAVLNKNAQDLVRELEVTRVMKAFKLNPYDVLDLKFGITDADVKKQYRKKSLLIHPDKFTHENASEAFDLLKKAESQLSDPASRKEIDAIMTHSRTLVLKVIIPVGYANVTNDDSRLENLKPTFDMQVRNKAKEVLIEDELARRRKQKVAFANEGAEKAKMEEVVTKRKRDADDKVKWEERREERISNWRDFAGTKKKKSKKNEHVLG